MRLVPVIYGEVSEKRWDAGIGLDRIQALAAGYYGGMPDQLKEAERVVHELLNAFPDTP